MPALQDEIATDFSRGMDDSRAATAYPPNAALSILNGRVVPDGTVKRRWGSYRLHENALEADTGHGAVTFRTAAGVEQEISVFGGKAFMSDDGWATSAEIASGLREDYYDFATMRVGATTYLFLANGDTTIKRWDGTTWDTLPNAPSGVKYIAVFNNRLYAAGHSGVVVQASKVADPETWSTSTGGLFLQVMTHDGDPITGIAQLGAHLLIFDEHATSYLDGYGEQTIVIAASGTGISRSVGCVAFRTIVAVGDRALCWLSERGIEYYESGGTIRLLTRNLATFMESIARDQIALDRGRPTAVYDQLTQDYMVALSTTGQRNDRAVIVNLLKGGRDWFGSPSTDRYLAVDGDTLLGGDGDYLEVDPTGSTVKANSSGYMVLASSEESSDPLDGSGDYLAIATNDTVPATLYIAPDDDQGHVIHSLGYDGFVRKHYDVDKDDELFDRTGGVDVTLKLVPRPFLLRRPRHRKRVRVVRVAAINDEEATLNVAIRAGGVLGSSRPVTIPASGLNQPKRGSAMMHAIDDAPLVEVTTTDRTRISLVGVSAEIMKERVR